MTGTSFTIDPADNPLDFYETPSELARQMVDLLEIDIDDDPTVLEPSAGHGALICALFNEWAGEADNIGVTAFEIDPKRVEYLRGNFVGISVRPFDFLKTDEEDFEGENITHVLMNPPFTSPTDPQAYMSHVEHAFACLSSGGVLVSVVPPMARFGSTKRHIAFRALVDANGGEWFPVPEGAFKASGTGVNVAVLRMRRVA